jgi:hypothetical protein
MRLLIFGIEQNPQSVSSDPDFLYAALDTATCAAFITESRMRFVNANQLHRKSGGKDRQTGFFPKKNPTSPMSDWVYVCGFCSRMPASP